MKPAKPVSPQPNPLDAIRAARATAEQLQTFRDRAAQVDLTPITEAAVCDLPPDAIDGFDIVRRCGGGGQAVVYEVFQHSTKRTMAIKVLHSRALVRETDRDRFRREVRVLSRLRHPHVVSVHDAGVVKDCPYLVMDFVDGRPIDQTISKETPIREVLGLFAQVCDAVNDAHVRGIIHRDITANNILVDKAGSPFVVDFGLAKLEEESDLSADAGEVTQVGQFIGTLKWASPEQVEGNPANIDVRTDVYSLGVVLYKLLTGAMPYATDGATNHVSEQIRTAPPKPPRFLRREIDNEVETIILKCLAKERGRRYQNAGALRDDLRRYLEGKAIEAKRDSLGYVLRKFVSRHAIAVLVVTVLVGVLVASSIAVTSLYFRAEREAELARGERDEKEKLVEFLERVFNNVEPSVARGRDTAVLKELMDAAATRIESGELGESSDSELRLRETIGDVYHDIAAFDASEQMLQRVVELAEQLYGQVSLRRASALTKYAKLLESTSRSAAALPLFEESLSVRRELVSGDHEDIATSLNNIGASLRSLGRSTEALPKYEEALTMYRRLGAKHLPNVATCLGNVAGCLESLSRSGEALPMYEEALAILRSVLPSDHPNTATSLNDLAYCLESLGRYTEALPKYEEALAVFQRIYPNDHQHVAMGLNNLGTCLESLSRFPEAMIRHEAAAAMYSRLFKGDHVHLATSLNNVAYCLQSLGRHADALGKHEEALAMRRRLFAGDHPFVADSLSNTGSCHESLGRSADALRHFEEALAMYRRLYVGDHTRTASCLNNVASSLDSLGRSDEALVKYEEALAMRRRLNPGDHPDVAMSLSNLGHCLKSLGRKEEALTIQEEALGMRSRLFPSDHASKAASINNVGACLFALRRYAEALPKYEEALAMNRRILAGDHPRIATTLNNVAACLSQLGRSEEALPMFDEALAMSDRVLPSGHSLVSIARIGKGAALVELGRHDEAEEMLVPLWGSIVDRPDIQKGHKVRCLEAIIKLFEAREASELGVGYAEAAAEWRRKLELYVAGPTE